MKLSEAKKYRKAIEDSSASLPDEEILEVPNLAPVWTPGIAYEAGFRVQYQGIIYRCLTAHTAIETWNPKDAPSLWAEVLIPDENVIPDWKQPESTNPYKKGDKVKHKGKIWVSDVDGNVWEPGVNGWKEIVS